MLFPVPLSSQKEHEPSAVALWAGKWIYSEISEEVSHYTNPRPTLRPTIQLLECKLEVAVLSDPSHGAWNPRKGTASLRENQAQQWYCGLV